MVQPAASANLHKLYKENERQYRKLLIGTAAVNLVTVTTSFALPNCNATAFDGVAAAILVDIPLAITAQSSSLFSADTG